MRLERAAFLSAAVALAPAAQGAPITVNVDPTANRHFIDARIYGLNYASPSGLTDLGCPLHRLGGNPTSRYNWELNADNRGRDFFYESIAYPSDTHGEQGDTFISTARAAGAEPMLTIPMLGWVAKLAPNRDSLASFSVAKYGAQEKTDATWPDAGNGILLSNGQQIACDPNDASVPANSAFQQGWLDHLVTQWGTAANGGLKYYLLDNEYGLWHYSYPDVHPVGASISEILGKMIDYGTRIRTTSPGAVIVGPEEWNFEGYLNSGADLQLIGQGTCNPDDCPDRIAAGGLEYLPYILDQLHDHEVNTGQRLLDVFAVHYYPQGDVFSDDVSNAMQLKRNRSTRSLWDPSYVDESYLNRVLRVIPLLKDWLAAYYPGLQIGLTEYNFGADEHINGATAQADVLGILGREGVDLANRWTMPDPSTPTYKAIKLYRNHDGTHSSFGNISVSTSAPDPDNFSVFGARRASDGALTVIAVAKQLPASGSTSATVNVSHFAHSGPVQVWQLTSANTISHLSDIAFAGDSFAASLPPQSITLFIVPSATPPNERAIDFDADRRSDLAVFHGSGASALWYIRNSSTGTVTTLGFGAGGYTPVVADYDGDGKTDVAVYHASSGLWFVRYSSTLAVNTFGFGGVGYAPVPGDYDGDGKTDLAVYHPASGLWFMRYSSTGATVVTGFGGPGYTPERGDFDGDLRTDLAVYHQPSGLWFIKNSSTGAVSTIGFGGPGYAAVPEDHDGDRKTDLVVYHGASGLWFKRSSTTGATSSTGFGGPGYDPVN